MSNKTIALVTGAAQGIGFACAQALAEDGAQLILADINASGVQAAAEELGGDALAMTCDMGEPSQINAMFDRIEAEVGPVTVLVNNAGIAMPQAFLDTSLEDFRKVLDVNLVGTFCAIQRAAKTMVAQGIEGSIVNMSSINAVVAIPTITAYLRFKGRCHADDQGDRVGAGAAQHPRERCWPRFDRHRNDGWRQCEPASHGYGDVAHTIEADRHAARDRRRGGISGQCQGQLHHRRNDLRRRWATRHELHLLKQN